MTPLGLKGANSLQPPEPATSENDKSIDTLLARAVADRLDSDPSLLRVPLENIERWLARGGVSHPPGLERWRHLLKEAQVSSLAFNRVLSILREDTEDARRWRDFSPFAGVLTSAERREIVRQCSYSH